MFVIDVYFIIKQKTEYEMRISDWSSDVCSSDLTQRRSLTTCRLPQDSEIDRTDLIVPAARILIVEDEGIVARDLRRSLERSEERRVGKVCVSRCRFRMCPSLATTTSDV